MLAAPTEIWPVSVAGWIAFILAILAFCTVLVGWGKMLAKFEEHEKRLNKSDTDLEEYEQKLTAIDFAFWGPTRNNGLYSKVRELNESVSGITIRNSRIDAVTIAREQGAIEAGREVRNVHRRKEDAVAFGEDNA